MYLPRALAGLLSLTLAVTNCKPPSVEPALPEISTSDYLSQVAYHLGGKVLGEIVPVDVIKELTELALESPPQPSASLTKELFHEARYRTLEYWLCPAFPTKRLCSAAEEYAEHRWLWQGSGLSPEELAAAPLLYRHLMGAAQEVVAQPQALQSLLATGEPPVREILARYRKMPDGQKKIAKVYYWLNDVVAAVQLARDPIFSEVREAYLEAEREWQRRQGEGSFEEDLAEGKYQGLKKTVELGTPDTTVTFFAGRRKDQYGEEAVREIELMVTKAKEMVGEYR